MSFEEYRRHDALGLADLVKKGQTTPEELLEIAIRRTEEVNPMLNAVIHQIYDEARQVSKNIRPESPFSGVPFLIKDLGIEVKGTPMRTGCKGYSNYVSTEDSFVVQKIRQAGLVVFGKTNTPEFGLMPFTEAGDYTYAKRKWNDICRRIAGFHEQYDLLLTPTLAQRPFKIGALQNTPAESRLISVINTLGLGSAVRSQIDPLAEKIYNWMPWTAFANITGQPSMSVPLYWTGPAFAEATAGEAENLPVGVMFSARFGEEGMLFRLAGQLEKASPWWDKVPEI